MCPTCHNPYPTCTCTDQQLIDRLGGREMLRTLIEIRLLDEADTDA